MALFSCNCCGSKRIIDLVSINRIPVLCNELHDTAEKARQAPAGDMDLCFCQACGHYFNRSYEPSKLYYSPNYETSLYASNVFRQYADALVKRLIDRYEIRGKQVLEIGCGRGEFLKQMCLKGQNKGIGFDTSVPFEGQDNETIDLTFVRDYFSGKYEHIRAELVICQQVLEHIENPKAFIEQLAATSTFREGNPVFYCEVPNGLYSIKELGIWDLIYEHVSYFSARSFESLLTSSGFDIINLGTSFGGQYLYAEARLNTSTKMLDEPSSISMEETALALSFADRFQSKIADFNKILTGKEFDFKRSLVWGAGSKGITFLNLIDPEGKLAGLIDKNSAKQGKHVGCTGSKIFGPEHLSAENVSTIFVMNPQYLNEIAQDLDRMGINPGFQIA